ncbi:MAG: hypothetical protein WC947_06905 [Elusimicrobiota bacterium]
MRSSRIKNSVGNESHGVRFDVSHFQDFLSVILCFNTFKNIPAGMTCLVKIRVVRNRANKIFLRFFTPK